TSVALEIRIQAILKIIVINAASPARGELSTTGFFYLGWSSGFFEFKNRSGYLSFIRAGIPRFVQLKTH
ncbi:hypothetical protein, partial [Neisseria meningitidis]